MKMKTGLIAAGAVLLTASTQAGVIALDDFSYADGALLGQNGGTGFTAAWTGGANGNVVASGVLDATATHGGNFRLLPSTWGDSGEMWVAIDFRFETDVSAYGGLSFFAADNEQVLIGDRSNADVWGVAVPGGSFDNSSISNNDAMKTGVAKITLGVGATSSIDLWVGSNDTDAVDVSGAADATLGGLTLTGVDQIRLQAGTDQALYDNFILGDTYQDVGAIPEPATLGLIAAFGGGLMFIRRRFSM